MTRKKRVRLKSLSKAPRDNVTVRFNETELASVTGSAKLYTNGDLSKWIRYAAMNFKPKSSDLEITE